MWKNHCILFFTDNEALVSVINKQSSKDRYAMIMVRHLMLKCLQFNILFRVKHIAGKRNVLADFLSRLQVRGCIKAVSRRFVSYELLPFVIVYVMTLHPWKRTLHGPTARRKNVFLQI